MDNKEVYRIYKKVTGGTYERTSYAGNFNVVSKICSSLGASRYCSFEIRKDA